MATQNLTFGDRDTTHLQYSGNWFLAGSYNASNVGQTGTLSSTSDLNAKVTFAFPQPVVAFYYYGIPRCCGGMYGICIDCDPNNPNYITIDAVNRTDDGHNPPVVLFSKKFDTLGMHEIIIANQNDPRFGKSQLTIASIVLEVPVDSSSSGGGGTSGSTTSKTTPSVTGSPSNSGSSGGSSAGAGSSVAGSSAAAASGTGSSSATRGSGSTTGSSAPSSSSGSSGSLAGSDGSAQDNNASSSSHTPLGAIIGGVLAALAFFLFIIILAFWIRKRRRSAAAAAASSARARPTDNGDNDPNSILGPATIIHPFSHQPQTLTSRQSPFMTMAETATPATSSLTSSSRGYGVGKLGHRPHLDPGAGQSVSTFSDATGLSGSSSGAVASIGANSASNSSSTRRREVDGGPVYSPVLAEDEEDTLPPDYMDVFAARRSTMQRSVGATGTGTPSYYTNASGNASASVNTTRAMSDVDSRTETSSARGGGGTGQMDLSPVRRKS